MTSIWIATASPRDDRLYMIANEVKQYLQNDFFQIVITTTLSVFRLRIKQKTEKSDFPAFFIRQFLR